jgi:hypothetical protein
MLKTDLLLPKGTSVAIAVQPPAGNTNMLVQIGAKSFKFITT